MEELQKNAFEDDEITLKELIQKLQEYFWHIVQYWKIVAILVVVFVSYMLFKAFTTPTTYKAELTFMVNEDEGGGLGGIAGILGNFGISGGGGGKFNLDKVIELSQSMKIMQAVLLHKCEVDGSYDIFANHLIKEYDMHENWEDSENEKLHGFLFVNDTLSQLNETEKAVLKTIYRRIMVYQKKNGQFVSSVSEDSGIMKFSIETTSQDLSIAFTETLYEKLSIYYIKKTIGKEQQTYDLVKFKADSISTLLNRKEITLANFKDQNRGLISKRDQLRESILKREVTMLTLMLGEAIRNLEFADFSLKSKTPFIQIIDSPFAPLNPIKKSKLMAIIMGGFIGVFIGVGFLVARKIINDTMKEETELNSE
jgi:G-rich domain on putative tyrosine kinase